MMRTFAWLFAAALMLPPAMSAEAQMPGAGRGAMRGAKQGQMCPECQGGAMRGHGMMGKGMGMGGMMSMAHVLVRHADELKLTDEQVGKLHRLAQRNMEARRATMAQMHGGMMSLHAKLLDPKADEAAIKAAAKAHTDSFTKMVDAAMQERKEALAVLNDQQRKALAGLKLNADADDGDAEAPEDAAHQH